MCFYFILKKIYNTAYALKMFACLYFDNSVCLFVCLKKK